MDVRLIVDILDEVGNVIVEAGTVFNWDDDYEEQCIGGHWLYIESDEVEPV